MGVARDEFDLLLREWVEHIPQLNRPETVKLFDTSHLDAFLEAFRDRLRLAPLFNRDLPQSVFSVYTLSWEGMWRGVDFDSPQYRAIRYFHFRYFVRVLLTHGLHIPEMRELRLKDSEIQLYLEKKGLVLWHAFSKRVRKEAKINVDGIFCYELVVGCLYDYRKTLSFREG